MILLLAQDQTMADPIAAMVAAFPTAYKRSFDEFCSSRVGNDADSYNSITSSDDEDSICDSEEEREENSMVQNIVSAAMAQPRGGLAQLLNKQLSRHVLCGGGKKKQRLLNSSPKRLGISESAPELSLVTLEPKADVSQANVEFERWNPDRFLQSLMQRDSLTYKTVASLDLTEFFSKPTETYDLTLIQAVRSEDVDALRLKAELGQTMHCANQFGHTLLHTAARRGATDVVAFFLNEANGLSPKVVCDMGRTPLHDACWTAKPNFEIIEMLLESSPDLLFLTDKRGFTPMAYVPKEHWRQWCIFLEQRGAEKLRPKEIF